MLTTEENDRLTRVGPGTPMGNLLRRYWQPVAPLAKLDEDPVQKIRVLGEDLVLYLDRSGRLGLIGSVCAHRSVDLKFGIPEANGLRCPYHGWCYDATGQCVETPLEAANSRMKDNIKIPGYPVQELGGLIWAYMGPLPAPVLPRWDFLVWPNSVRQIAIAEIPCNWLQCYENGVDPFHGQYLHGDFFEYELNKLGLLEERRGDENISRLSRFKRGFKGNDGLVLERTKYGYRKGVRYSVKKGADKDFVSWYPLLVFPNVIAGRGTGGGTVVGAWKMPIDDTHTMHFLYRTFHVPGVEAPPQNKIPYFNVPIYDENHEPILDHVLGQDWIAWISQGAIADRTKENVGGVDVAIIEIRRILEEEMQKVERGEEPTFNVFRDPAEVGEMIELEPKIGSGYLIEGMRESAWDHYHEGYWRDEVDRWGLDAATPLAIELARKAAEQKKHQQVSS